MHPSIWAVIAFSAVILCCFQIPVTAATEHGESDFHTSIISSADPFPVAATTLTAWNGSNFAQDEPQQSECQCKWGKCVRDGPRKVCTCEPTLALISPTECHYCDCGIGFNCTFYETKRNVFGYDKTCICPEGYLNMYDRCIAKCNETHPCQNGGTCVNEMCSCMKGTMGDYCESVFWCSYECRPRLTVNCVYDQEAEWFACQCKNDSLVFDYKKDICKPCPCGAGKCVYGKNSYDRHDLKCDCYPGYKEVNGYCKRCDCGSDSECEFSSSGEKICKCRDTFVSREGHCVECGCDDEGSIGCNLIDGVKHCFCPKGFEDSYGVCTDIDECKFNDTCPKSMKCINTLGSFKCGCEEGYRLWEENYYDDACIDIDECEEESKCYTWEQRCVNLPGTYKCECREGFIPAYMSADPRNIQCDEYKESWLPAGIAIATALVILTVALAAFKFIKYRSRR